MFRQHFPSTLSLFVFIRTALVDQIRTQRRRIGVARRVDRWGRDSQLQC